MKIKAIEQILKASKTIIYFNRGSCQWIGDGSAFYPLNDLPHLTNGEFFAIFDIPEDKRSKFYFSEMPLPESINISDYDKTERILERGELAFVKDGQVFEPLPSPCCGITFINQRYLKPFANEENGFQLAERISANGKPYIVVKDGLFVIGVINPFDLVNENFVDTLQKLTALSEASLDYKESLETLPSEDNDPEQTTLDNSAEE